MTIEVFLGIVLILFGIWMILLYVKKNKIDSFYDIKALMIGIASLIGGIFIFLKLFLW
jgi:uncharacterized membrane protein HdeD (DUF308 family)